MSQVQIAWLEFILVGGLGVILTLSGMMSHIVARRTNMLCTNYVKLDRIYIDTDIGKVCRERG